MRSWILVVLVGCAPALSSFRPAHVGNKGTIGVEVGGDFSVPTNSLGKVIDVADVLVDQADDRELTAAERDTVIEAGTTIALAPPSPVTHFGFTYVPVDNLEVGVRNAGSAWRLGARYQLLHQATSSVDLSVGLGASRFAYEFPINDVFGILTLDDFKRYTVDVPITIGQSYDFVRWWGGPRLMFEKYGTELTFTQPPIGGGEEKLTLASVSGTSAYVGGQAGVALGYKHLFFAFELTVVQLISTAEMRIAALDYNRDFDIGGLIIYPGVALIGDW